MSITSYLWTSLQNFSYMVLSTYYIDSNGKLQKRILNYCKLEYHQIGEDICKFDTWKVLSLEDEKKLI